MMSETQHETQRTGLNKVWTNRLVAGSKTWGEMPEIRQDGVKKILACHVANGKISAKDYKNIVNEDYLSSDALNENLNKNLNNAEGGLDHANV